MGKYLMLWEIDMTKLPVNPKERVAGWKPLIEMVKQDLKKGIIKDWGEFVGEGRGYSVAEGTEVEIQSLVEQFVPFVRFKVHSIASLSQVEEGMKVVIK